MNVMIDVEWLRECAAARQDLHRALWVGALSLCNAGAWLLRLLPQALVLAVALALTVVSVGIMVVALRRRKRLNALWALKVQSRGRVQAGDLP